MSGGQHADAEALASGVPHRGANVGRVLGEDHQRRPVDRVEIPGPAGRVVTFVAGGQRCSAQSGPEPLQLSWNEVDV